MDPENTNIGPGTETVTDTNIDQNQDDQFREQYENQNQDDSQSLETQDDQTNFDDDFDIDDEKLAKALAKRGITDPLDKIKAERGQLSKLTPKHQDAMKALKALRSELGDEYESILGRAMSKSVDDDGESPTGFSFGSAKEPEVLKSMEGTQKKAFLDSAQYAASQAFPKLIEAAMPSIVEALELYLDQKTFKAETPEYNEIESAMKEIAGEYGITKRDKATLSLLKKLAQEKIGSGLKDLAGNEDKTTRKTRGIPAPGGSNRQMKGNVKLETDDDYRKEFERRQASRQKED